ncbi:D-aminoacyl-tRNA deacylase [Mycoplasmatota bacterium zrk1]
MRVLVQRVNNAKVIIDDKEYSAIDSGLLLLIGFTNGDSIDKLDWMVKKCLNLRIFEDSEGKMNKSVLDVGGSILSVSQFTLYGNARKGNRPSFIDALEPTQANELYSSFNDKLSKKIEVSTGVFGEHMKLEFTNDGPVTLMIEK